MFSDPKKNVLEFGFIPGQKVVDFGAGSGHYASALSTALGPTGLVIAVDLNQDLLNKLRNDAIKAGQENVEVMDGDVQKPNGTKLRDAFVDGVVMSNILNQLSDIKGAGEEAKRILKPGGKVCVVEWTEKKGAVLENDARRTLESVGLTFERSFRAGESHYGLILRKPLQ